MSDSTATVSQDGERLIFSGALLRGTVASLWGVLSSIKNIRVMDLSTISQIDSAGLAMLAQWKAQQSNTEMQIVGQPSGLAELQQAYRMDALLLFAQ